MPTVTTATTTAPRIGAILLRVSTKGQADDEKASYRVQRDACLKYAADRGIIVPADLIWQEVGKRDQYYTRDGLQAALTAADQERYQALIVWRLDRLTDDIGTFLLILRRLQDHGALPWSATEPDVDLSTKDGLWYVHTKLHFQVQPERRTTATRTNEARHAYTQEGRPWAGNRPRYGYRWVVDWSRTRKNGDVRIPLKERLEADPETAPVVVLIFAWADNGKTLSWIARALSGEEEGGIYKKPSPRQHNGLGGANAHGDWNETTVATILGFEGYAGERWPAITTTREPRNDGSERHRQRKLDHDEWTWITPSPAPALVDPAQWQRVQRRLTDNKRYSARNGRWIGYEQALLIRGMARCARCGGPMEARPRTHSYDKPDGARVFRYQCRANRKQHPTCSGVHRQADTLDQAVWAALLDALRQPDALARLARRSQASDQAAAGGVTIITPLEEYAALQKTLAAKERDLQNLTLRHAAISVDDPAVVGYNLAIGALGADVAALRRACEHAQQQAAKYQRVEQAIGEWEDYLALWRDNLAYFSWPGYPPAARRRLLEAVGARVIVHPASARGPLATLELHLTRLDRASVPPSSGEDEEVGALSVPVPSLPSLPLARHAPARATETLVELSPAGDGADAAMGWEELDALRTPAAIAARYGMTLAEAENYLAAYDAMQTEALALRGAALRSWSLTHTLPAPDEWLKTRHGEGAPALTDSSSRR